MKLLSFVTLLLARLRRAVGALQASIAAWAPRPAPAWVPIPIRADRPARQAVEHIRASFQDYPRNRDGGFWHGRGLPHEMWIDGVFMGGMFLARCAAVLSDGPFGFSEVASQIRILAGHCRNLGREFLAGAPLEIAYRSGFLSAPPDPARPRARAHLLRRRARTRSSPWCRTRPRNAPAPSARSWNPCALRKARGSRRPRSAG